MQLEVTELFVDSDFEPFCASGSRAEWGDNAGQITFAYAKSFLDSDSPLFKEIIYRKVTIQRYFLGMGGWEWEEITSWTDRELVGVMVQAIAADYRELERFWQNEYPDETLEDVMSMDELELPGSLDLYDGKWYFYVDA